MTPPSDSGSGVWIISSSTHTHTHKNRSTTVNCVEKDCSVVQYTCNNSCLSKTSRRYSRAWLIKPCVFLENVSDKPGVEGNRCWVNQGTSSITQ